MFMEIGWPAPSPKDYNDQGDFIKRLPVLMENVKPSILTWSLLHDVGISQLSGNLAATGLITKNGSPKPPFQLFKELGSK